MGKLFRQVFFSVLIAAAGFKSFAQVNQLVPSQTFVPDANKPKKVAVGKKLEAARNNFIGKQLNLSNNESDRFWPIYRQYQQELTAVRILKRLNNSSAAANGTEQIDKEIYYESQIVAIRKRYRDSFSKILPPEKVSKLYKSEQEFNDELIKQLSERSERAGN